MEIGVNNSLMLLTHLVSVVVFNFHILVQLLFLAAQTWLTSLPLPTVSLPFKLSKNLISFNNFCMLPV